MGARGAVQGLSALPFVWEFPVTAVISSLVGAPKLCADLAGGFFTLWWSKGSFVTAVCKASDSKFIAIDTWDVLMMIPFC